MSSECVRSVEMVQQKMERMQCVLPFRLPAADCVRTLVIVSILP